MPGRPSSHWTLAALLLLLGCALRIVPWTSYTGMAFDESWYRKYLLTVDQHGLGVYPELSAAYLEDARDAQSIVKLPPTRLLFVVAGWAWKRIAFHDAPPADLHAEGGAGRDPALISLHRVSTLFSCLGLIAAWAFARRLLGSSEALAVLALVACSPLLLHMSQHPLIDGVFAACVLCASWTLWESLQRGARPGWLVAFAASFALMVLAKENALFPAAAFAATMLLARRCGFGEADRRHWLAAICGGSIALCVLSVAAGGLRELCDTYLLLIRKVPAHGYALATGGGPWSRYLVDLMIFTPATLCLALGGVFHTLRGDRRAAVLLLFLAITYLAMCNVRHGMNLRYTTIWVFPLCALAVVQAAALAAQFRRARLVFAGIVAVLCALDLAQYRQFFVTYRLYELPTGDLLRAEQMLK